MLPFLPAWLFAMFAALGVGLFIYFIVTAHSNLADNGKLWIDLKADVNKLWVLPSFAILTLYVGCIGGAFLSPQYLAYYAMFLACFALGCSIIGLNMVLITR